MLFRPTTEADLDRVVACTVEEPISWIPADRYLAELAEGMYRPQWTWIAEDGERVLARALWWGQSDSEHPIALDCLYVDASVPDRAAVAAELLTAGLREFGEQGARKLPLYNLTLPNGWRADPAVSAALAWRREAALAAGLTDEVERLRFEWTPDLGVPASGGRLVFADASDEEFLEVFRRIAEGSLDAETRRNLATKGAQATARHEMDFYLGCPGKREWWRIAHTPEGAVAGLAIPSATPYNAERRLPRRRPGAARPRLRRRHPRRDHPHPRRERRGADHSHHRHDQRADGRGLRARRLPQHTDPDALLRTVRLVGEPDATDRTVTAVTESDGSPGELRAGPPTSCTLIKIMFV